MVRPLRPSAAARFIPPDEPVFAEPWEAKVFAFGALSARLSGRNHTRLVRYIRGPEGTVARIQPAQVLPDTHAHFIAENAQHVYAVRFESTELWGPDAEAFALTIDCYDDYLEPA